VNKYKLDNNLWVYHIDLYRLKSTEEIDGSGFWDLFADEQAFFIIEWIDRVDLESLPLNFKKLILNIEKNSDDSRNYKLQVL
jgi:tRNA A37 threonylcarbamoyladenosine biosynthesis protein TsaE